MKRIYSLTASAALIAWSLAPVYGASKAKTESPSAEAQKILEHIYAQSATIGETAFTLREMARRNVDPDLQREGLAVLRENVNKIGSELQSLEATRDSLSEWESKVFDQIVPLMQNIADDGEKATRTFNSDRERLYATPYAEDVAEISKDADQVTALLRDNLKLAKTREKERRLGHILGESSGF